MILKIGYECMEGSHRKDNTYNMNLKEDSGVGAKKTINQIEEADRC